MPSPTENGTVSIADLVGRGQPMVKKGFKPEQVVKKPHAAGAHEPSATTEHKRGQCRIQPDHSVGTELLASGPTVVCQ